MKETKVIFTVSTPLAALLWVWCRMLDQSGGMIGHVWSVAFVASTLSVITAYMIAFQASYWLFRKSIMGAEKILMEYFTIGWGWGLAAAGAFCLGAIVSGVNLLDLENLFQIYNAGIVLLGGICLSFAAALARVHLIMGVVSRRQQNAG